MPPKPAAIQNCRVFEQMCGLYGEPSESASAVSVKKGHRLTIVVLQTSEQAPAWQRSAQWCRPHCRMRSQVAPHVGVGSWQSSPSTVVCIAGRATSVLCVQPAMSSDAAETAGLVQSITPAHLATTAGARPSQRASATGPLVAVLRTQQDDSFRDSMYATGEVCVQWRLHLPATRQGNRNAHPFAFVLSAVMQPGAWPAVEVAR